MGEMVERESEWLKILSLFHYITAGITALIACFPLIHVTLGAMLAFFPQAMTDGRNDPPRAVGFMFMGIGLAAVTTGWMFALGHFLVAKALAAHRRYLLCLIISGVTCFMCMFSSGVVSIATLIVLLRPGVKSLFDHGSLGKALAVP